MIAPRSAGCVSLMSASMPSAAGVAPASTKRPASATSTRPMRARLGQSAEWFTPQMAPTMTSPPTTPTAMIVVRR